MKRQRCLEIEQQTEGHITAGKLALINEIDGEEVHVWSLHSPQFLQNSQFEGLAISKRTALTGL